MFSQDSWSVWLKAAPNINKMSSVSKSVNISFMSHQCLYNKHLDHKDQVSIHWCLKGKDNYLYFPLKNALHNNTLNFQSKKSHSPLQHSPSPSKPSIHSQEKLPSVLLQVAYSSHGSNKHSSMSERKTSTLYMILKQRNRYFYKNWNDCKLIYSMMNSIPLLLQQHFLIQMSSLRSKNKHKKYLNMKKATKRSI